MEYESLHVKAHPRPKLKRLSQHSMMGKIAKGLLSVPFLVMSGLVLLLFNFSTPDIAVSAQGANRSTLNTQNLLDVHNQERTKYGLAPLKISQSLNTSAQRKALEMLRTDCWSHYCPDGRSPWEFFKDAGYEYLLAGENLAEGFFNTEDVIVAWMNSRTHRDNILRPDYEEVGFGIVKGYFQGRESNVIIAVHFGTPSPDPIREFINPTPGDLPTPSIVQPRENSFSREELVTIRGTAPDASEVVLILNSNNWATVPVNNGVFSYEAKLAAGRYELQTQARVGTRTSAATAPTIFTIDRTANKVTLQDITIVENSNGELRLNVLSADLFSMRIGFGGGSANSYLFNNAENDLWSVQVPLSKFTEEANFVISTRDKAGNEWSGELPSSEILFEAEKIEINNTFEDIDDQERPGRVISADIKAQVNIGALFMFASLFGVDFLTLTQTGLTRVRGKLQLHMGLVIIVLLIALAGSLSGQILEGISIS